MAKQADDEIRRKVQEVLDSNIESGEYGLKADVVNGVVILAGIVDTLSEKESISKMVADIEGVRGVENNIAISTDGAIDDRDVTFEVMEELKAGSGVNLKHIGVKSVRGRVFLKGRVNSEAEREAAVNAAAKARGVREVVSQLEMETARELTLDGIFHSQVNNDGEENNRREV
ncbi:MAG: BON domain-containing protein [Pelotomaculum sp.]|nr:BON domain-containing protein [Pelotomaculum sp.]